MLNQRRAAVNVPTQDDSQNSQMTLEDQQLLLHMQKMTSEEIQLKSQSTNKSS